MAIFRKPVSLGDIAREAGVTRMAVSFALRNQAGVSDETKARIVEIAGNMGYVPDARVGAWLAKVRDSKSRDLLPLAWLNTDPEPGAWQKYNFFAPYFEGASVRCREFGYKLEEFRAGESGMTKRRLSEILYHRGIQGVIIAPSRYQCAFHFTLNWKNFACASFEKALLAPRLNRVIPDYFYNFMLVLKLLRRFGYRRIGIYLHQFIDRRTHHAYWSAINYFHAQIPPAERVPAIFNPTFEHVQRPLTDWLKKHKIDVVVGQHSGLIDYVEASGFSVPGEIGVVHTALDGDCSDWAGIWIRKREIGAATAQLVVSQLQNGQLGLPQVAMDTLVPGCWHPGSTLLTPKPVKSSAKLSKSFSSRRPAKN